MKRLTSVCFILITASLLIFGARRPTVFSASSRQEATPTATPSDETASPGHITFVLDDHLYLVEAVEGATPQDLTALLDEQSPGMDSWINMSLDGAWLLFATERFDPECMGWPCLILSDPTLENIEVVKVDGAVLHPEGGAVAAGGNRIVYVDQGGTETHIRDLWVIEREAAGEAWSTPRLLSENSPYPFNIYPTFSDDGSMVIFTCSHEPYAVHASAICEVELESRAVWVILTPADGPNGSLDNGLLHPNYAPDGSIVFEANWVGELVWRLFPDDGTFEMITEAFNNDNSPCVLPDGRIASLWLGRADNQNGLHELKVMDADGSNHFMLVIDQDVLDIGLGCGA